MKLEILNLLGQSMVQLMNNEVEAGFYQVDWKPSSDVTSGIYFYRIEAVALDHSDRRFVETKKMLLLR